MDIRACFCCSSSMNSFWALSAIFAWDSSTLYEIVRMMDANTRSSGSGCCALSAWICSPSEGTAYCGEL